MQRQKPRILRASKIYINPHWYRGPTFPIQHLISHSSLSAFPNQTTSKPQRHFSSNSRSVKSKAMSDSKRVKVVLQVSVSIAPENIELWKKHFKIICDQVVREPECAYFFFGEEIGKPGHFYWTEGWTENKEWLQNVRPVELSA